MSKIECLCNAGLCKKLTALGLRRQGDPEHAALLDRWCSGPIVTTAIDVGGGQIPMCTYHRRHVGAKGTKRRAEFESLHGLDLSAKGDTQ